jgi:cytochrome c
MIKKKLSRKVLLILILAGINPLHAEAPGGPGLGEPAMPGQIAEWDIDIMPDGKGLPAGTGNAREGKQLYDKHCANCHGPAGIGGTADQLAGARMKLTDEYPEQTIGTYWPYATTLFDMIRRSMPMPSPGVLDDDEVYAITAYLLYLNKIIDEDKNLDAESLPGIVMPNRDGFINIYESESK